MSPAYHWLLGEPQNSTPLGCSVGEMRMLMLAVGVIHTLRPSPETVLFKSALKGVKHKWKGAWFGKFTPASSSFPGLSLSPKSWGDVCRRRGSSSTPRVVCLTPTASSPWRDSGLSHPQCGVHTHRGMDTGISQTSVPVRATPHTSCVTVNKLLTLSVPLL